MYNAQNRAYNKCWDDDDVDKVDENGGWSGHKQGHLTMR